MKPDWKDAPAWANYLAQDKDGTWFWYEQQPSILAHNKTWYSDEGEIDEVKPKENNNWKNTLEQRP